MDFKPADHGDEVQVTFFFEGKENAAFGKRVFLFLNNIIDMAPWLKGMALTFHSENSFPHSSGIASSASGMSAIALCVCSLGQQVEERLQDEAYFYQLASHLSRLGSGSASRSVYPYMGLWGKTDLVPGSSDLFAIPYQEIAPVFKTFHDDILIVSRKEKSVSSTAGHALMDGNIYADNRYKQAEQRLADLIIALGNGNVAQFGKIAEDEALTLHALMMCSDPSYILMEPATISLIKQIRQIRRETGLPLYFSLDAGPNIHLLYPDRISEQVEDLKDALFRKYCVGPWRCLRLPPAPDPKALRPTGHPSYATAIRTQSRG
jgi:diphosphomevalonate decarboxylase